MTHDDGQRPVTIAHPVHFVLSRAKNVGLYIHIYSNMSPGATIAAFFAFRLNKYVFVLC